MPQSVRDEQGEIVCRHCGGHCTYDMTQRCWRCDDLVCMHCVEERDEPLCPDCRRDINRLHISPMLASTGDLPTDDENWAYEFKWDGARAIGYWNGSTWRLESRNLLDVTAKYPELEDVGETLGPGDVILDGEIVALDEKGRPSFQRLQHRMHAGSDFLHHARRTPVQYFIFDVLWANGESTIRLPYTRRREILDGLGVRHPCSRVPPMFGQKGEDLLKAAADNGLEGIVAKQLNSRYEPGVRSASWRKIKLVLEQEFVVGGYLVEKHGRGGLGSLLLGCHDANGVLHYVGNVGTGWDERTRHGLLVLLRRLERPLSPFAQPPSRSAYHVAPRLIVRVEYRRWPQDGQVQQASYKGLVDDRPVGDVVCQAAKLQRPR